MRRIEGRRWRSLDGHTQTIFGETKEREPDVVILGDSIMSQLEQRGVWTEVFAPMHALNFSIIGDQIQHVLWRIQNGELENIKPKVVVLYAGELNLRCTKPQEVSEGTVEAVKAIREKQPNTFILIQEILPRGLNPNPLRDSIENYNILLRKVLQDFPRCKVVPVGDGIVKPDGTISHADLYDWYYPTNDGYLKAFRPLINELNLILQGST